MDVGIKVKDVNKTSELVVIENTGKDIKTSKKRLFEFIKRVIDIIAGLIGTIILIPLTIGVFIAQKIVKDEGPIFYKQYRIGKNGKPFKMYKYRTMVLNADKELERYLSENADMREEYHTYKKLKNDPRITKLGNFLRKTSLDEFPQFINVLKGDLSLVGPRPYLLKEREEIGSYYPIIISCKPGLTGFWQINGRSDATFDKRLEFDKKYNNEKSLKTDFKILLKTVEVVFKGEGAV